MASLPIRALLTFFDEAPGDDGRHASAIIAVMGEEMGTGLLLDYFRRKGAEVQALPIPCTQGTPSGSRLDRWVRVVQGRRHTYFQVEIKNWAAAAIGGRRLAVAASRSELRAHKKERWSQRWNGKGFRQEQVKKVLQPMKPPVAGANIEPLVCFWDAMHPSGHDEAMFKIAVHSRHFERVWVFSMSSHLRNLLCAGMEQVEIDSQIIGARLRILRRIIK